MSALLSPLSYSPVVAGGLHYLVPTSRDSVCSVLAPLVRMEVFELI